MNATAARMLLFAGFTSALNAGIPCNNWLNIIIYSVGSIAFVYWVDLMVSKYDNK